MLLRRIELTVCSSAPLHSRFVAGFTATMLTTRRATCYTCARLCAQRSMGPFRTLERVQQTLRVSRALAHDNADLYIYHSGTCVTDLCHALSDDSELAAMTRHSDDTALCRRHAC
jgi:hypothetical protein